MTLTRAGITRKKQFHSWDVPLSFQKMADFPGVYVVDGVGPKAKVIAQVSFMRPNGPLVPPLLEACQRRYGSSWTL